MGKVFVLPDVLCNQIAAGEVVERPAAVVKELVENSLDAGSRRISVSLLQGGRKEIKVVDNGEGMSADDALLALERHATSKIRTLGDLQSIHSLGFRGEALPSIASVSRFEMVTREQRSVSGSRVAFEGGVLKDVRETGCPVGTVVTVRDLFFNLPARRKFLRSVDTEMSYIKDQFLRLAAAHPSIHFQLTHEGKVRHDFPPAGDSPRRIAQIFGPGLAGKLQPFSLEGEVRLRGMAGPPELRRNNTQSLFFYVNGRPVRDRMLNQAVLNAYDTLLPKGRLPVAVLFVEVDPSAVDVNIHPTKREVRFRNLNQVMSAVRDTVREALGELQSKGWRRPLASPADAFSGASRLPEQEPVSMEFSENQLPGFPRSTSIFPSRTSSATLEGPDAEAEPSAQREPSCEAPLFSRLRVLGQLGSAYLLLEAPDGLVLVDQHAAHERVLYDRLQSEFQRPSAQRLLKPVVMDLLPRESSKLLQWEGSLKRAGFEMEPFGGDSFVIHAVPAALSRCNPEVLLHSLLETANLDSTEPRHALLSALAKTAACHGAIRSGRTLKEEEILELLKDLDRTQISATCPHGRPLWWKLAYDEIARFFGRT